MQTLYKQYNKEGELLYVGISGSYLARQTQHSKNSPWFSTVTTIVLEHYATRKEVEDAEYTAIKLYRPKYNITHNDASIEMSDMVNVSEELLVLPKKYTLKLFAAPEYTFSSKYTLQLYNLLSCYNGVKNNTCTLTIEQLRSFLKLGVGVYPTFSSLNAIIRRSICEINNQTPLTVEITLKKVYGTTKKVQFTMVSKQTQ